MMSVVADTVIVVHPPASPGTTASAGSTSPGKPETVERLQEAELDRPLHSFAA